MTVALSIARIDIELDRLLKGYPEYRPNQTRDARGRWSRDGSVGGASATPKAPRKPRGSSPKALARVKAESARAIEAARAAAQAKTESEARARLRDYEKAGRRTYDYVRSIPDKEWADPTFADFAFEWLTDWNTFFTATMLGFAFQSMTPNTIYGLAVAGVGSYLAARYVYRKIRSGGRYQGVRLDAFED